MKAGKTESEGPLGALFDERDISNLFGKETWELPWERSWIMDLRIHRIWGHAWPRLMLE